MTDYEAVAGQQDQLINAICEASLSFSAELPAQIDDYMIERRLGEGGLGDVFLAKHPLLSGRCVVKVIQKKHVHRKEIRQRFLREMKVASGLDHENIVQVRTAGVWQEQSYMVMEYLKGEDLSQRVQRTGALPLNDACHAIAESAKALDYAHAKQVTHRDIKPSNIFITNGNKIKVIDFGLALAIGNATSEFPSLATKENATPGTPAFMSPEQLRSSKVGPKSDIYSLGLTFVYLLTGEAQLPEEALRLTRTIKGIPAAVVLLIERMLANDEADRPASMNEVAVALAAFTGGTTHSPSALREVPARMAWANDWRLLMLSTITILIPFLWVSAFGWPNQGTQTAQRSIELQDDGPAEDATVPPAIAAVSQFDLPNNFKQAVISSIRERNRAAELVDDSEERIFSMRVASLPQGVNGKRLWPAVISREQAKATARLLKVESIRRRAQSEGLTDILGLDEAIDIAATDPKFVGEVKHLSSHQIEQDGYSVVLVHAPQSQIEATLQSEIAMDRLLEAYRDAIHGQGKRLMQQMRWDETLELWRHLHKLELSSPGLYIDTAKCFFKVNQPDDAIRVLNNTLVLHSDAMDWMFYQEVGELLIKHDAPEAQAVAAKAFDLAAKKYTVNKH